MLDLSTLTPAQQIAAVYIGYYDRAADPFGSDFWVTALANPSLSLEDVATDFSTQAETVIVHPFFTDPTPEAANAFITTVYLNLFNRAPDDAGLTFWSGELIAAINGEEGALSVGEIILAIIGGAQDSEAGNDRTTILNKIEVAVDWTDAADAAGLNTADGYSNDADAQASAKSIIEGVTDDGDTVSAAKAATDSFFAPAPISNDAIFLTSATDAGPDFTGDENNDEFLAYVQQNPFAGGISNSLSSADRLDGAGGQDRLYAEVTSEFLGVSGGGGAGVTDIQPRIKNIEEIDIEARDTASGYYEGPRGGMVHVIDGKHITDHEELSSFYSDGDLKFENVTTLTSGGAARNTESITVGMDHTDNFNSDCDASDLTVLFDNDYLLSGRESEGKIFYWLLDEDAELVNNPNRLNNIDVDGIRFTIDTGTGPVDVTIESDAANTAGTHQGFVNALQAPLQALIADGTLPAGTTLTLDPTNVDDTFLDDGSQSDDIPAIVLTSGDGSPVVATGFSRIEEEIGEYDVYGRFDSENTVEDQPITVNIDLHKAGRGGEGGDLIIGGKSENTPDGIADGIEVFKINVRGAGNDDDALLTKPSNVGTITSTGNELREVYIATDPEYAKGDTFASLTVRNGFDQDTGCDCGDEYEESSKSHGNRESGDLQLINADAFLGDLTLGDIDAANNSGRITNADTITAQGGGDVTLGLLLDGEEEAQAYSVTTGGGNDEVDVRIDGDALDFAGSSLNIHTNGGDDVVKVDGRGFWSEEPLNQAILDNVHINTGDGNDEIHSVVDSHGNLNIDAGAGDDFINTSGGHAYPVKYDGDYCGPEMPLDEDVACWALNFDDAVHEARGEDLAGVPTSLAYIGGATVTVTLSGAGIEGDLAAGGGIMAEEAVNPGVDGAVAGYNGYESSVTIGSLNNGNRYFGDQTDVNDAVIEAIENDPILSKLLKVIVTENNTLVIESRTGGEFDESDLKIEINQRDMGAAADWDGVESEARSLWGDSGIVITDLGDANGDDAGPSVPDLRTTFGSSSDDHLDSANDWYTGLSASRDDERDNASQQIKDGAASQTETDNVINAGTGDDLVVLSTEAGDDRYGTEDASPRQIIADDGETDMVGGHMSFTRIDGNTLRNSASNETLIFEDLFGDDTIMNFTTADPETETVIPVENRSEIKTSTVGNDEVVAVTETFSPEVFTLELSDAEAGETGSLSYGDGPTVVAVTAGDSAATIASAIEAAGAVVFGGVTYTPVASGGTVVFTETAPLAGDSADVTISDFLDVPGVVVGLIVNQDGASNGDGVTPVAAAATTFSVCFSTADNDGTYTFDGETVPVLAGESGADIATAFGAGIFDNWHVTSVVGDTVTFTAGPTLVPGPSVAVTGPTPVPAISAFGGTNTDGEPMVGVETYNAGLDFLDYSDYLTSQEDVSSGGADSSASNNLIAVTLDYNENNTLGGSGDGAANTNVEANEVAVVRMANDGTDGETFASLSASDVAALFNNGAGFTGFGGDSSFGDLDAANFSVETYQKTDQEELIGDGKAIFKVENPGNLGEYKVFELTWSGDETSESGSTVSATLIGTQDYGTSLTGLDDINLVGSDAYGDLIANGFADIVS